MTTRKHIDVFTDVHKGIRRALFAACTALGRAESDPPQERAARALLAEALHFVAHHGENEDTLLLPLVRERDADVYAQMGAAHHALDDARASLAATESVADLYLAACAFTGQYLAHMDDEERVFEPRIVAALSTEELISFGRQSVQRTAPADQRMMLGWMLPALPRLEAAALLDRLPSAIASELRTPSMAESPISLRQSC